MNTALADKVQAISDHLRNLDSGSGEAALLADAAHALRQKPWCQHCGKETTVECWDCASRLNPVIPQVVIDGLKSAKKIFSVMIPNHITWADWDAACGKWEAALAYLETLNAKKP